MPSYPDPAPRSPWKAHAAKRAESSGQHVLGKIFGKLIAVGFAPEEAREGGAWTRILLRQDCDYRRPGKTKSEAKLELFCIFQTAPPC